MTEPYYEDELATMWHGDSLEHPDWWVWADVLVTDPPYGIGYYNNGGNSHAWSKTPITGDHSLDARDRALELWGDGPALVFGAWRMPRPPRTVACLTWEKGEQVGMGDLSIPWRPNTEEVYVLGRGFTGKRTTSVLYASVEPNVRPEGRLHPNMKPLKLMTELVAKTVGVVADPFAGSGSTLVAAKRLGRRAVGVELDERYCEVAAQRLAQDVLPLGVLA